MALEYALEHKAELQAAWLKTARDPRYRWLHGIANWWELECKLEDSTWSRVQMVHVAHGVVAGYLAGTRESTGCFSNLTVANFGTPTMAFGLDVARFLDHLFVDLGAPRVQWSVVANNPVRDTYHELARRLGGRCWGHSTRSVLVGREYRDEEWFEVLAEDYFAAKGVRHGDS